jgi:hypothetical protein
MGESDLKTRAFLLAITCWLVLAGCAGERESTQAADGAEEGEVTDLSVEDLDDEDNVETTEGAEEEPPVAEEPRVLDEMDQRLTFDRTLTSVRSEIADNLEAGPDVETVDRIEYADEVETQDLVIAVTSGWAGDDRQQEAAWGVARHVAQLWSDDFWQDVERSPEWAPGLELTVDSHVYSCPGRTMTDLADRRLDRGSWQNACS